MLKKIGDELMNQLIEVLHFLGEEEGLEVVIEEKDYNALVSCDTFLLLPSNRKD